MEGVALAAASPTPRGNNRGRQARARIDVDGRAKCRRAKCGTIGEALTGLQLSGYLLKQNKNGIAAV
jgi:hypothetical protein